MRQSGLLFWYWEIICGLRSAGSASGSLLVLLLESGSGNELARCIRTIVEVLFMYPVVSRTLSISFGAAWFHGIISMKYRTKMSRSEALRY